MRRLALPLAMIAGALVPDAAEAQERGGRGADQAFCAALSRVVAAAGSGFDYLPRGQQQVPGSINERRGITRTGDGPPRAAFYAVMMRDESRQRPNPVVARFGQIQQQVTRCLPEAQANPTTPGQGGAVTSWVLPMAIIGLRRDDGEGAASTAEIELSVASRW